MSIARAAQPDLAAVRTYLVGLQDAVCAAPETEDGTGKFQTDEWQRPEGGGGRTRVMTDGAVFEKAGIAFSHVKGTKPPPSATAHRPERESDRREESADRCEAEQSGRTRRTEKGDTALFRSSAGRVLTHVGGRCHAKGPAAKAGEAGRQVRSHYMRVPGALMLRLPAACGFYVASWTATTGSDDAALRDG